MQPSLLAKLVSAGNVSPSSLQSHLSTLLPLLSSPQDQSSALLSLLPLLRSSSSICSTNCEKLLPLVSKIMTRPGLSLTTLQVVYQCLALLVANSVTSSDTGKLVSSLAPSFISSILSTKPGPALNTSLQLLAVLMTRYPGSCGQARSRLQEKLVTLVGKEGEQLSIELLGKCFSLLPQVGGGGRDGAEHINQYSSMMSSLVSTVHTGLSSLYPHVREFDTFNSPDSATPFSLPQGGGGQLERNITLGMQLDRTMGVLGQLLIRGFPHVRVIPVDLLLSIPTRLLSLTLPSASTPSHHLLSSILSQLTCSSLSLACQLVRSLRDQLLPEAGSINSLLVSGLGRVSCSPVRAALYSLLSGWLEVAGAASGMELCAKQIFSSMFVDIVPSKEKMILEKGSTNKKQRKHGKKGGGGNGMTYSTNSSTSISSSPLSLSTCTAALTSLNLLLSSVGPWLDKETHTLISSMILSQLLSPGPPHLLPSLLLSCLTTLVTVTSPTLPSPAQICPAALSLLSHSPTLAPQVRAALQLLQNTVHPARPSLDIQDTHTVTVNTVLNGRDAADEKEDEVDVELSNIGTQTEAGNCEQEVVVNDTTKRIKELEDALKVAKAAESAARAQVMRKDIELSRAAINAQKRAANEEKFAVEAKKSKMSEEAVNLNNFEVNLHPLPSNVTERGSVEAATDESTDLSLSVGEMLQDFSAKLNSNLIPSNFTGDSDSE